MQNELTAQCGGRIREFQCAIECAHNFIYIAFIIDSDTRFAQQVHTVKWR